MTRLSASTSQDLVTLSDPHESDRHFVFELKITGFRVAYGVGAVQTMKDHLSEFIREKMNGVGPHRATVIGRWRITSDGRDREHVPPLFLYFDFTIMSNSLFMLTGLLLYYD